MDIVELIENCHAMNELHSLMCLIRRTVKDQELLEAYMTTVDRRYEELQHTCYNDFTGKLYPGHL